MAGTSITLPIMSCLLMPEYGLAVNTMLVVSCCCSTTSLMFEAAAAAAAAAVAAATSTTEVVVEGEVAAGSTLSTIPLGRR